MAKGYYQEPSQASVGVGLDVVFGLGFRMLWGLSGLESGQRWGFRVLLHADGRDGCLHIPEEQAANLARFRVWGYSDNNLQTGYEQWHLQTP